MKNINFVKNVLNTIRENDIKLVSFDVFDTLLFRMVIDPVDVFTLVGDEAVKQGILPPHLDGRDYKNIRIEAEKEARRKKNKQDGTREIFYEEIFDVMPCFIENTQELAALEIEIEKRVCYANPIMVCLLNELKEQKVSYVLTSDMYLHANQIQDLLMAAGYEEKFEITVSSEYKKTKAGGALYSVLFEKFQVKPEEILHIGDNYNSDYHFASICGIHAIHYDMLSDEHNKELFYERMLYPDNLPELYAMRRYVPCLYQSELESDIWYRTGAQVYGPLLTMMSEWVLDTALQEKVYKIYPLMREGKIFTSLLRYAAKVRGIEIEIEPLYISRKAVYVPSMNEMDKKEIRDLLNVPHAKLHDTMKILGIEEKEAEFRELYDDSKDVDYIQMAEYLYEYLQKPEVKQIYQEYQKHELDNAFGYFSEKGLQEPFITVDIGFHGTIQKGLEKVLDQKGIKNHNIHLLGFSPKGSVTTLFKDIDLRGFVGNCGQNDEVNTYITWHPRLLEQALMCDEGSTKSYEYTNGKYIPIKGEVDGLIEKQIDKISKLHQGILDFQKEYLRIKAYKGYIKQCELCKTQLTNAYIRLVELPTCLEATSFGKIAHDENYGVDASYTLCDETKINQIINEGWESYIEQHDLTKEYWIEGLRTCAEKDYEFKKLCSLVKDNLSIGMATMAEQISKRISKDEKVVIVGAGNAGKTLKLFLEVFGVEVEAFVDNNKSLQGMFYNGVPIVSMSHTFQSKCFALGTLAFVDTLIGQAKAMLESGSIVFMYRDGIVAKTIISQEVSSAKW